MISGAGVGDNEFTQVPIARLRLTGAPWLKRAVTGGAHRVTTGGAAAGGL